MPNDCNSRMMSITCEFRMSTTFSLNVSPSTVTRGACVPLFRRRQALARDAYPDGIVDAPAGEDHVGMVARLLRSKRQVIGIDTNAVATDEARCEIDEIPFCRSRRKHVAGIDVELVEDRGKLVHESDVEVALCVLDHLGRFRDFYRRRLVQA